MKTREFKKLLQDVNTLTERQLSQLHVTLVMVPTAIRGRRALWRNPATRKMMQEVEAFAG